MDNRRPGRRHRNRARTVKSERYRDDEREYPRLRHYSEDRSDRYRQPRAEPLGHEALSTISLLVEESMRIQHAYYRAFIEPLSRARFPEDDRHYDDRGDAIGEAEDALLDLMRDAQRLLFIYPVAAQKAFSALTAEGRQYAGTDAGREWVQALSGSDLLRKGRRMWSALTFDMLEERAGGALPSAYLELLRLISEASETSLDLWAEMLNPLSGRSRR